MSQRLTLKSLRDNLRISPVANVCPDDDRLAAWANNFQERAFTLGRWFGSTQLVRFCLSDEGCLVLPREIAVIEAATINGHQMNVNNAWYQFITPHRNWNHGGSCGPGIGVCGCCGCGPIDLDQRDTVASYRATTGTNKKIRTYISSPGSGPNTDVGKKIIYQGKDKNGNWVRRPNSDGVVIDGEEVILTSPFVDTVTVWGPGAPVAVIKDETKYNVLVYSLNTDDTTEIQLASYQPTETTPTYQRIQMRNWRLCSTGRCSQRRTLTAIVSLQHIPVKANTDWLLFQNITAYKDGILSEKHREEGNVAMADSLLFGIDRPSRNARGVLRHNYGMGAIPLLEAELRKMTGDETSVTVRQEGYNSWGFV